MKVIWHHYHFKGSLLDLHLAADPSRFGGPLPRPTIKHKREAGPGNWHYYVEVGTELEQLTCYPIHVQLQWGKGDGEWFAEDIFSLDGVEDIVESRCNTRKVVSLKRI